MGKAFCYCSFTNTRLTNQAWIVLLAAVKDLNNPFCFYVSADNLIQLTFSGTASQVHTIGIQKFMLFVFLLFAIFRLLLGLFLCRKVFIWHIAHKLIEHRESSCTSICFILFIMTGILGKHTAHFIAQDFQVIIRKTHLLYRSINLRDTQASCALQAIPLIHGHTVFHFCNENNGNIFLAFCTQFRLHTFSLLGSNSCIIIAK